MRGQRCLSGTKEGPSLGEDAAESDPRPHPPTPSAADAEVECSPLNPRQKAAEQQRQNKKLFRGIVIGARLRLSRVGGGAEFCSRGGGAVGGPPPPSGDPASLEAPKAPKKFFGLN